MQLCGVGLPEKLQRGICTAVLRAAPSVESVLVEPLKEFARKQQGRPEGEKSAGLRGHRVRLAGNGSSAPCSRSPRLPCRRVQDAGQPPTGTRTPGAHRRHVSTSTGTSNRRHDCSAGADRRRPAGPQSGARPVRSTAAAAAGGGGEAQRQRRRPGPELRPQTFWGLGERQVVPDSYMPPSFIDVALHLAPKSRRPPLGH